jgi:hypothetical protein
MIELRFSATVCGLLIKTPSMAKIKVIVIIELADYGNIGEFL